MVVELEDKQNEQRNQIGAEAFGCLAVEER